MHLTGNNPFLRLGSDVHAGHYQFAVQYISLEQHSYFTADKPSVYALNSRLELSGEMRKLHNLRFVQ